VESRDFRFSRKGETSAADTMHRMDSIDATVDMSHYCRMKNGYAEITKRLCSVTIHPLGFLLLSFFNESDVEPLSIPEELQTYRLKHDPKDLSKIAADLHSRLTKWLELPGHVPDLTDSIAQGMSAAVGEYGLIVHHCQPLIDMAVDDVDRIREGSLPDILVCRKNGDKNDDPAMLLIQIGLAEHDWWAIALEAVQRLWGLVDDNLLVEPMIMAIVRVKFSKESSTNSRKLTKAQMGVFLVIPGGTSGFHLALLWRGQLNDLKDLASDFAKIIQATQRVCGSSCRSKISVDYQYLGRHCCRIGDKVRSQPMERPS
jgi:hypothetical protein